MNEVEIQGRIMDMYEGRNVTIIKLFVESDGPTRDEKRVNFPTIIFNYLDKSIIGAFKKNDFVNVKGTLKVRTEFETIQDPATGRTFRRTNYHQFIRGLNVAPMRNDMSEKFNTELGGYYDFKNEVLIEGELTEINDRHGVINMLVRPTDEKFLVSITSFAPNHDFFMSRFTVGSKVCVKCEVQTQRKERADGSVVFYENCVVSYIDKKREPRVTPVMEDPTEDL